MARGVKNRRNLCRSCHDLLVEHQIRKGLLNAVSLLFMDGGLQQRDEHERGCRDNKHGKFMVEKGPGVLCKSPSHEKEGRQRAELNSPQKSGKPQMATW